MVIVLAGEFKGALCRAGRMVEPGLKVTVFLSDWRTGLEDALLPHEMRTLRGRYAGTAPSARAQASQSSAQGW